jgi:hypothetical protein
MAWTLVSYPAFPGFTSASGWLSAGCYAELPASLRGELGSLGTFTPLLFVPIAQVFHFKRTQLIVAS